MITHSMGALLFRTYAAENLDPRVKRVVMLAPVNHGSEVADKMSEYGWWVSMFGQSGLDLRTCEKYPALSDQYQTGATQPLHTHRTTARNTHTQPRRPQHSHSTHTAPPPATHTLSHAARNPLPTDLQFK